MKCATNATPVVLVPRCVESTNNSMDNEIQDANLKQRTDSSITRRRLTGTRIVPRNELQHAIDTIIALIENDCKDGSMMFHHTQDAVDDDDDDDDGSSTTRKKN